MMLESDVQKEYILEIGFRKTWMFTLELKELSFFAQCKLLQRLTAVLNTLPFPNCFCKDIAENFPPC